MSRKMGITRSMVWKHIRDLRSLGYDITSSKKEGYALNAPSTRLLPHEVKKNLKTRVIGREMQYLENTPSTIWVGKQMFAGEGAEPPHGLVIIAEEQTGGVGRLGRAWVSPPGGIWITILVKPKIPVDHIFMITMAGSIAVARALRHEYNLGALIKWPNDIFIGDRKISGLLVEISAEADRVNYCLLSIGVNVNIETDRFSPDLRNICTSVLREQGQTVNRAPLLARILKEFETRYDLLEGGEYDSVLKEWKSLSCTLDRRVRITTMKEGFEGEAVDIDNSGALLVRKDNGQIERVIAGDCFPT